MENDQTQQHLNSVFSPLHMQTSDPHRYPHSHHGTPATEYPNFVWSSPPNPESFVQASGQRPTHQSLHPLVMPQWPSMLSSQALQPAPNYYSTIMPQTQVDTISPTPLMTPVSPASTRSGSTQRRTLTDDERRKMCEYHEQFPTAKQTEIGSRFGVERSTVSKVLRQKDKYLQKQVDGVKSPERRAKGKSPDIEKTLSNWVSKEQKKGTILTDKVIRDKAQYFASVSGPDHAAPNPASNASWLKAFKRSHNIHRNGTDQDELAPTDSESVPKTVSRPRSAEDNSPQSPKAETPPLQSMTQGMKREGSPDMESPEGFADLTTTLSGNSFSAAFAETPSSSFSPISVLSPSSPFFNPDPSSANSGPLFRRVGRLKMTEEDSSDHGNFERSRNQNFPLIHQGLLYGDALGEVPQYVPVNELDSPMHDMSPPSESIDQAMNDTSVESFDASAGQPQTMSPMSPNHAMHPPPAPFPFLARRPSSQSTSISTHETRFAVAPTYPSQEEARQALQIVWQYFASQPHGAENRLDMEETAMMGKFMEKLKIRQWERTTA